MLRVHEGLRLSPGAYVNQVEKRKPAHLMHSLLLPHLLMIFLCIRAMLKTLKVLLV